MEQATICARSYFVHHVWFEIAVDSAGNIFALAYSISISTWIIKVDSGTQLTGLGEEGAETLIGVGSFTLFGKIAIRLEVIITSVILELNDTVVLVSARGFAIPGYRVPGNKAVMALVSFRLILDPPHAHGRRGRCFLALDLTSQQEFAI